MKNFRFLTVMFIAFCLISAQGFAAPFLDHWQFDPDVAHSDFGTYTNVDRLAFGGQSSILQDLGPDQLLTDGDTFVEYSVLFNLSVYEDILPIPKPYPGSPYDNTSSTMEIYAYANTLTGYIINTSYDPNNPYDVTQWSYDYYFDPGQTIYFVTDTDADPSNGVSTILATWTTVVPSGGKAPSTFFGGTASTGTSNFTMKFQTALAGVWKDAAGNDFADMLSNGIIPMAFFDSHNTLLTNTFQFIDTDADQIPNEFSVDVYSEGSLNVAVPEPATMLLFGSGLLGLGGLSKRRRKK